MVQNHGVKDRFAPTKYHKKEFEGCSNTRTPYCNSEISILEYQCGGNQH